ncbi:DNA polymerase zeta catalytic subunit-like 1, partial [Homarus americanus]
NGVINNKVYQPHESHVPYVLQFLMDHNLHGMNMIHLATCRFRRSQGTRGPFPCWCIGRNSHRAVIARPSRHQHLLAAEHHGMDERECTAAPVVARNSLQNGHK